VHSVQAEAGIRYATVTGVRTCAIPISRRPVVFGPQNAKAAVDPPQFLWPVASSVGDADKAIAAAAVKIEQTYTTPDRHHNQMERAEERRVGKGDTTRRYRDARMVRSR